MQILTLKQAEPLDRSMLQHPALANIVRDQMGYLHDVRMTFTAKLWNLIPDHQGALNCWLGGNSSPCDISASLDLLLAPPSLASCIITALSQHLMADLVGCRCNSRHCIPTVMQMDAGAIDVTRQAIGQAPCYTVKSTGARGG